MSRLRRGPDIIAADVTALAGHQLLPLWPLRPGLDVYRAGRLAQPSGCVIASLPYCLLCAGKTPTLRQRCSDRRELSADGYSLRCGAARDGLCD